MALNNSVDCPPARGGDARFEAEAADDIFEGDFAPLFRGKRRGDVDAVGSLDVGAFQLAKMQVAGAKALHQKRADLRLLDAPADDIHDIGGFDLRAFDRLAVDQSDHRSKHEIDQDHETDGDNGVGPMTGPGEEPDGGGAPQRRRRVQASHVDAFLPYDPGSEKAYACHDLGCDPRRVRVGELALEDDEDRGAERNQRIRAQPGEPLAPLTFEADNPPEDESGDKIERVSLECGIIGQHHGLFQFFGSVAHGVPRKAPARSCQGAIGLRNDNSMTRLQR